MAYKLHVAPYHDTKDHLINLTDPCWCGPQELFEADCAAGAAHVASCCCTFIHKPIRPVVGGHDLDIRKVQLHPDGQVVVEERR